MTHDTNDTSACNTKGRGRSWGPNTWNNYSQDDLNFLKKYLMENTEDYVMQEEVGESGTPHIQFCMKFKNARTFGSLKKQLPKVHLEKSKNWMAAKTYCEKEDTRIGDTFKKEKRKINDPLEGKELYEWQKQIIEICNEEPDNRTIHWIVDYEGNRGKTSLAKHICLKHGKQALYMAGKASDMKYGIFKFLENENNDLKICLFDFTRSLENYISYEGIESIKNGIFYNTKYESTMVMFNPPHIICFSNFYPNKEKLSRDRWNIIEIDE